LKAIEKIVKEPITVASGSPWQIAGEKAKPARNQQRRRRPAGGGGGQGGQRRRAA
jgi:hypothetical protein